MDEISKDENGSSTIKHTLLAFPDSNISTLQVEAIKKRNIVLNKYHDRII
jgi:hypothetical protein